MIKSVLRGSAWIFFGNIVLSGLSFCTTVVLTRVLSVDSFGMYRFVLAILPLLAVATLPDLGTALTRSVAQGRSVKLWHVLLRKIKYGYAGSLVSLSLSAYYFLQANNVLSALFLIVSVFLPLFDTFLVYANALYGVKEFKKAVMYQMASRAFSSVALMLAALTTNYIPVILGVYFIAQIAPQIFFFFKVAPRFSGHDKDATQAALTYGTHFTVIGVVAVSAAMIDKMLVWQYYGSDALALYSIALIIVTEGSRIIDALSTALLPFFAASHNYAAMRGVVKRMPLFLTFLFLVSAIVYVSIPYFFEIFFPAYSTSVSLARISSLLIVLMPVNAVLYRFLVAEGRRRSMLLVQSSKLLSLLVVFFFLHQEYGFLAAVFAVILSEIVLLAMLAYVIRRILRDGHAQSSGGLLIPEKRFSRKIIVGSLSRSWSQLRRPINAFRDYTFRERCVQYPDSFFIYTDGSWVSRKVTSDQSAIESYLQSVIKSGQRIFHAGIGSSRIAQIFVNLGISVDGVTVVPEECIHADSLNLPRYHYWCANKYSHEFQKKISGLYHYIVDNDIAGYACCRKHFEDLFATYISHLDPDGELLIGLNGAEYFDTGFPLREGFLRLIAERYRCVVRRDEYAIHVSRRADAHRAP